MDDNHPFSEGDSPRIQRTTIGDDILEAIYASDQDMYPAPLPYKRLKSWVEASPDLCVGFEATSEAGPVPVGAIITLPLLRRHWEDILVGKLKETDIEPAMFARDGEAEVGLHVFHIERFDTGDPSTRIRSFARFALESIREVAEKKAWKVLGYSALTATPAGREAFRRMDFVSTGYKEVFLMDSKNASGGGVAEMVCVYPGGDDALDTEREIHSRSEMVVRRE